MKLVLDIEDKSDQTVLDFRAIHSLKIVDWVAAFWQPDINSKLSYNTLSHCVF